MVSENVWPLRQRVVPYAELVCKVVADEDGLAERLVVAYQPRHERHPEDDGTQRRRHEKPFATSVQLIYEPASSEGKKRQRRGVGQRLNSPEQAIADPRGWPLVAFHLQRQHEQQAEEERGQAGLPNPPHRPEDSVGKQRPNPS